VTGQMSMISGNGFKSDFRRWDCTERRGRAPVRASEDTHPVHKPMLRVLREVGRTVRGETHVHAELRSRIAGVTLLSIILDLLCGLIAWRLEHGRGEIHTLGDALFWTTTQMLTVSSQFPNPLTTAGKLLDVFLELYAVVVVTSVAGAFASFFHGRARQRLEASPGPAPAE
jgi:hypothetical protein